jgi:hypothetical protein
VNPDNHPASIRDLRDQTPYSARLIAALFNRKPDWIRGKYKAGKIVGIRIDGVGPIVFYGLDVKVFAGRNGMPTLPIEPSQPATKIDPRKTTARLLADLERINNAR